MKLKSVLRCKHCGNIWRYEGEKTSTICPLCGQYKDARDRSDYARKYQSLHPEIKERFKNWLKTHKYNSTKRNEKLKKSAIALVSKSTTPVCIKCGCNDIRLLEVNHKNGGGSREQRKKKGVIYWDITTLRRGTNDLEILCRICNARHYLEKKYGELPYNITWVINRD